MWSATPVARLASALGLAAGLSAAAAPPPAAVQAAPSPLEQPSQDPGRPPGATAPPQQPPPSQPPQKQVPPLQFETRVDLVLVDVNVVDATGRPVEGLTASDFRVSVNGRPRRIHTVQFVGQTAPPPAPLPPAPPHVSSNRDTARGRLYMLVVDEGNLSMSDTHALDEPLAKFFAGLTPRDRVGLVTIPAGVPRVDFTADVARVRRAVARVVGMPALSSSLSRYNVSVSDALLLDAHSPEWNAVVARECSGVRGYDASTCAMDVEAEAHTKLADIKFRATATLGALQDAIRSLGSIEGPKILVLVSGGLVLERQDLLSIRVAEEAAAANTTIYVLHLERPLVDASVARPSPTLSDDLALGRQGLEMVAGRARGEVFNVPVSSEFALARIATETSGYYLIGVEAEPDDRNGQAHQVHVELTSTDRGLTLRSRRELRFDRAAGEVRTDEERLGALLDMPVTVGEVPLQVSTYALGDPAAGRRRVLIAAEIDDGAAAAEELLVGYTVVDWSGRGTTKKGERLTLEPVDPDRPSPLRYASTVSLDPGEYSLKLAVVRPDGRRGSIEHALTTAPVSAGRLQVGDLFVLDAPATASVGLRADVLPRVSEGRLAFYCELFAADPSAFAVADVVFEVAASDDGVALLRGRAKAGGTEATRRVVQGAMPTTALTPGDYVARLNIIGRDGVTATRVRAFRIQPRTD